MGYICYLEFRNFRLCFLLSPPMCCLEQEIHLKHLLSAKNKSYQTDLYFFAGSIRLTSEYHAHDISKTKRDKCKLIIKPTEWLPNGE